MYLLHLNSFILRNKIQPYEITNMHVKHSGDIIKIKLQNRLWLHRRWKFKPEDVN
jgi:hypothetical protein